MIDGRADQSRHDNLTWAIAQKLDVGSAQLAIEQALLNTKSKGSTADLNQALKARDVKYGSTHYTLLTVGRELTLVLRLRPQETDEGPEECI